MWQPRLFLRMIEHLHPSVVSGPASFPASLASAYPSPAVLDQPIHHPDGVPPINFPAPLVIQTCLELHRFCSASRMRSKAVRPAERCGFSIWGVGRAGNTCSPQTAELSRFLHFTLQWGVSGTEELGGKTALLHLLSCFEVFSENEE